MSWDVLMQKFPEKTARPEEVPDDYLPPAVGSRADVASAVGKLFRNVESNGESFVTIDRTGFAMEISLGDEEPCSQLLLHVHVSGDETAATKAILRLANHLGMRAIDCSTSEFVVAEPNRGRRKASEKKREDETRHRRRVDQPAQSPEPPLEWLPGVVMHPCMRYIYLSLLPGESPKQQQKAVFRGWVGSAKEHAELDAVVSGPSYVLTLPGGESFGDFCVARRPVLVTETEAEMIPRVQKGAALVHTLAAASGRQCGEIENGSTFVCDDGQRIPLVQCAYYRLRTDADYGRKSKRKKKG